MVPDAARHMLPEGSPSLKSLETMTPGGGTCASASLLTALGPGRIHLRRTDVVTGRTRFTVSSPAESQAISPGTGSSVRRQRTKHQTFITIYHELVSKCTASPSSMV